MTTEKTRKYKLIVIHDKGCLNTSKPTTLVLHISLDNWYVTKSQNHFSHEQSKGKRRETRCENESLRLS